MTLYCDGIKERTKGSNVPREKVELMWNNKEKIERKIC